MNAEYLNTFLGALTIVAQILILGLLISLYSSKVSLFLEKPMKLLGKFGLLFSGLIALFATIGSLVYSEILGYVPCDLCWIQRIFIYPLAFILIAAHIRKDTRIVFYGITLSVLGGLVALYQHFLQFGLNPLNLACGAANTEGVVSCAQTYVREFGYITMPFMTVCAFLLMILMMIVYRRYNR